MVKVTKTFLQCTIWYTPFLHVSRDQSGTGMFSVQVTVAKVVEKMMQRAKNETTTINTIYRESLQEINQDPQERERGVYCPCIQEENTT